MRFVDVQTVYLHGSRGLENSVVLFVIHDSVQVPIENKLGIRGGNLI